ncbi:UNVERIFIED_ORG: hypothetical protein GGE63_004405 [Rhizobium esperanzae]|nr:hypothetical protein Bra5_CH03683 [Rhizobium phaseoli Brasil 5]
MRAGAGYLILLLAMPLAALAVVLPANVYRAQGIDAPDCDGALQVLIFALPVVLIYMASVHSFSIEPGGGAFIASFPFSA